MKKNNTGKFSNAGLALAQPFCMSAVGMAGGYPLTFSCANAGFRPASGDAAGNSGSSVVSFVPKSSAMRFLAAGAEETARCA